MKAAMFHGPHQPLTIEEVDIDKPMGREVLVRTVASGVCHSDLHFVDGFYPFPTPAILGHEAAGIVEEVGLQVGEFKRAITSSPVSPSSAAIATTASRARLISARRGPCGPRRIHPSCPEGPARQPVRQPLRLREKMLVHENALVKIDDTMPLIAPPSSAAGVTTGWAPS